MNKAKSPAKSAPSSEPAAPTEPATPAAESAAPAPFTARESGRLLRINRFLVKVADPALARSRAKVAYTTNDHQEGWRLYRVAAGEGQPIDAPAAEPIGSHVGILQHLDDFENKWFPRTRRIIERFAPEGHRVGLAESFFRDLQQQPLGPLVVGSVSTFLDRVEALEKSSAPGAAEVRRVLAQRGIDAAHIKRLRQTLDEARALKSAPAAPTLDPTEALRARRTAYDALWLWWKDWRETFQSEVDGRQRRELGLIEGAQARDDEGDDETDAVETPAAAPSK